MRKGEIKIDDENLKNATNLLKAIAHPVRLSMVNFIKLNGEVNVNKIYNELKLEQSITSQHLRVLREAKLVNTQRDGKYIFYSINSPKLAYIGSLVNDFISKKE